MEYCSAVWCSAVDTHLKLLDHVVSGTSFLTGGVFECDFAHRRSVAVLCMLYKIRCYPMHPLYGALPAPYVLVWVTSSTVIAHWYTYGPPRCRTSQYSKTFIPLSVSLWNDVGRRIQWCGTGRFQEQGEPSYLLPFCLLLFFLSFLPFYGLVLWGWGLRTDRVLITLYQPFIANHFFNNNNTNNHNNNNNKHNVSTTDNMEKKHDEVQLTKDKMNLINRKMKKTSILKPTLIIHLVYSWGV